MAGLVPAIRRLYGCRPGARRRTRLKQELQAETPPLAWPPLEPRTRRRRGLGFRQPIKDDDVNEHEGTAPEMPGMRSHGSVVMGALDGGPAKT